MLHASTGGSKRSQLKQRAHTHWNICVLSSASSRCLFLSNRFDAIRNRFVIYTEQALTRSLYRSHFTSQNQRCDCIDFEPIKYVFLPTVYIDHRSIYCPILDYVYVFRWMLSYVKRDWMCATAIVGMGYVERSFDHLCQEKWRIVWLLRPTKLPKKQSMHRHIVRILRLR